MFLTTTLTIKISKLINSVLKGLENQKFFLELEAFGIFQPEGERTFWQFPISNPYFDPRVIVFWPREFINSVLKGLENQRFFLEPEVFGIFQ